MSCRLMDCISNGREWHQPPADPSYVPPRDLWREVREECIRLERDRAAARSRSYSDRYYRARVLRWLSRAVWPVALLLWVLLC